MDTDAISVNGVRAALLSREQAAKGSRNLDAKFGLSTGGREDPIHSDRTGCGLLFI